MSALKTIALDIDDVIANCNEAVRAWSNETAGKSLAVEDFSIDADYWGYYEKVWEMHDIAHLQMTDFLDSLVIDQSRMDILPGAQLGLQELAKRFRLIFITSRNPAMEAATRRWLGQHLTHDFELHFAKAGHYEYGAQALSKGEIAKNLGASLLIDDSIEHIQSALDHGIDAILFGNYGWQRNVPKGSFRAESWSDVLEFINEHWKS